MGLLHLIAVALLAGTNVWLFGCCLVPLRDRPEPEFILSLLPLWQLPAWWLAAAAVVAAAWALARRQGSGAARVRWPRGARAASIVLLSLPLVALAALATPFRQHAAPWVYLFLDLQPWVFGGVVVLLALDLVPAGLWARLSRRFDSPTSRLAWLDAALVAVLAVASLSTSGIFRFQSALNGDEPKYVRYLENWYRGRGMDVDGLGPIEDLPRAARPALAANFRRAKEAATLFVADVGQDLRRLAGLPAEPRPGPAKGAGGWFVNGKRGGVYQVHNAGYSFLLFPGYVIDRAFLNWTASFHPQFPSDLYCTATLILMLYVCWGLATFRLLADYSGRAGLSWILTCVVLLSLPSAAFAYQYYPEVAAGLAVALLARFAWLSTSTSWRAVVFHGLVAGYLPWLHVRFGLVALVFLGAFAFTRRRTVRPVLLFAAAFAVPVAALGAFYYHVTGSLMPWSMHALCVDEAAPFNGWRAVRDLPNYWLDAGGGLLAHAPFYVLAVPGVWLMWRRAPAVGVATALAALALAVPAAGHGWVGGGTSPLRLVAAIVPLLALPLADAVARAARSRWFVALFALLSVVSVQNGWTYSTHLIKSEPWLLGPTVGGWLSPLLFFDVEGAAPLAQPWFWWALATLGLLAWPIVRRRRPARAAAPSSAPVSWTLAVSVAAIALAALGSVVGAWTGHHWQTKLMMDEETARLEVLGFETRYPGAPVVRLPSRTRVDLASTFANASDMPVSVSIEPGLTEPDGLVTASIETEPRRRSRFWGTAAIDFGDRTPVARRPFVGGLHEAHRFAAPGDYPVRVALELPGTPGVERTRVVRVSGELVPPRLDVSGVLPADLVKRPVTLTVQALRFRENQVVADCELARKAQADGLWLWVVTTEDGVKRARFYWSDARASGGEGRTVQGTFTPVLPSDDRAVVGFMVGTSRAGRQGVEGRSDLVAVRLPGPVLRLGAEVVEPVRPSGR